MTAVETVRDRRRLFGTDGMRGVFGEPPLDEPTVRALGDALGQMLAGAGPGPRVVLGGDTRASTPTLCAWLAAGLERHGVAVQFLGTVPTPCLAYTARSGGAQAAIAVSASHNPWRDNGVKLIGGDGFKWSTADEASLEDRIAACLEAGTNAASVHLEVDEEPADRYRRALAASLDGPRPLDGLRLVLDAANGAASSFAEPLFRSLGADVTVIHARPDGSNINRDCGSTHPASLVARTVETGADLGVAFDGDADRAIFVDETGTIRDGDDVLFLWAKALDDENALPHHKLVATSMSNLGLEVALDRHGIGLVRCDVGDRAVVQTMRDSGLALGGEQSGHIVHLGLATTGDGLLTALQVAGRLARGGRSFSALLDGFERFPQLIENVRVGHKPDFETLPTVVAARDAIVERLGDEGRLVLRYSGTEPLARIMLEGRDRATIEAMAEDLAAVIRGALG